MTSTNSELERLYYKHLGTTIVQKNGQPDHVKIKGLDALTADIQALINKEIIEARVQALSFVLNRTRDVLTCLEEDLKLWENKLRTTK